MWNNLAIQPETWYVGYCRVLFLVSLAHLSTHPTEEESAWINISLLL